MPKGDMAALKHINNLTDKITEVFKIQGLSQQS